MLFQITVAVFLIVVVAGDPASLGLNSFVPDINPFTFETRIVGGHKTTIEELPWQVSLQAYTFHFCGGSIISEDTILTAGHCSSYSADLIKVRVGSSNAESGGAVHDVAKVIRHENFTSNNFGIPTNDVAILKLKTSIKLGKNAQPVRLFDQNEEIAEGTLCTISGWGSLIEGGSTSDVLMTVDVPIVSKAKCNKAYKFWGGLPAGQICAAFPNGGKDTCRGDSGGPLVIGDRQAGIVSWGNGCARKGYPGAYTEIAFFRDWLREHAGI